MIASASQYADSARQLRSARRLVHLSLWTAAGVVLAGLEHLLPQPLPWVKLGIANVVALLVLELHGWRWALLVNGLRAGVVGLLLGTWSSPVALLSLAGALGAVLAMAGVKALGGRRVSPVGISAAGAFVHTGIQFLLVSALLVRHSGLLAVAGPSLLLAIVSGSLTGLLAIPLLNRLRRGLGAGASALDDPGEVV